MKGKRFYKGLLLTASTLLIQTAVVVCLCWSYTEELRTLRDASARELIAGEIIRLSKSLQSLIDEHPADFAPAARTLVQSLKGLAADVRVRSSFDDSQFTIALDHVRDMEKLSATDPLWYASSHRPPLVGFAKEQTARASHVVAQAQRHSQLPQLFAAFALGAVAINAAALLLFIRLYNKLGSTRLDIISDNTDRLQQGQSLHPMFSGSDDFAQLDRRFHEMADALHAAQESLRKGEARFRLVLENMPVGVMLATTEGTIQSVNPKCTEILGCDSAQLCGKPVTEFLTLPTGETLDALARQGRPLLIQAARQNQSAFAAEMLASRYRDDAGEKLLVSFEDVTWRIELEKMKREFMAMISHDIRTPLTSISATLGMLSAGGIGKLSAEERLRVEKDEDNLEHLMRLLNDLLSIEKIASASFTLHKTTTSTKKIVERSMAVVKSVARSRNISISVEGDHQKMVADEDRLVQVLTNLLTNALKFSPDGGAVTIGIGNGADQVELKVGDKGPGIAAADQLRIFETFEQVEGKDFAGAKGMGLGLAICKKIVEQHGGRIGVISEQGKGSTFWLTIPHASQST